jgi:hypothetical protein
MYVGLTLRLFVSSLNIEYPQVPQYFNVVVRRPIGLHVEEGDDKIVIVKKLTPDLGAARTRRIELGDQIVSMSASWGDRMWEVNSVESFVVGVRLRTDTQVNGLVIYHTLLFFLLSSFMTMLAITVS